MISPTGVTGGEVSTPEPAVKQDAVLLLLALALASAGLYLYMQRRLPPLALRAGGSGSAPVAATPRAEDAAKANATGVKPAAEFSHNTRR